MLSNFIKNAEGLSQKFQDNPTAALSQIFTFQKIKAGTLLALGYMLSPLCWWNDLIFNLPIAYGFGYVCSLMAPELLIPCTFLGYWFSNLVGILLMQWGAIAAFRDHQAQEKPNLKRELLMGIGSSTIYTLIILILVQSKIVDLSFLFPTLN